LLRSQKARKSGAWALAYALGLFALLQVTLATTAETYIRLRDPLYGDKLVKLQRLVAAAGPRPVVVMLGSSRTGLALHGRVAEAELNEGAVVFNFGVPSAGPITQRLYLQRLMQDGIAPDLLLVEVLPSMLARQPDGPHEAKLLFGDRIKNSERAMLVNYGFDEAKLDARWRRTLFCPAYHLRFQLMTRIAPSWLPWQVRFDWSRGADDHGWGSVASQTIEPEARQASLQRARNEYAPILADFQPGGEACWALRDLLLDCRERNIPVRMVLMPEGKEFRSWFPEAGVNRLLAHLEALRLETGTPLIDARIWLIEDDFYDSHHMFTRGAERFSRRLASEVIAPVLAEKVRR
jgi:hypothetical protein